MSVQEHRKKAHSRRARAAVLTVTSTRTLDEDLSGQLIADKLVEAGHAVVARAVVADDVERIQAAVQGQDGADVILLTGGTGLARADVTPDALAPLFTRRLDGFGELFRWLSFEEVGAAAMLSRACAGQIGDTLVFALPGSTKACRLAMDRLVIPELAHLLHLVDARDPAAPAADAVHGWRARVAEAGGTVHHDQREPLPDELASLASVTSVLQSAGESAVLVLRGGARYSLWGWPDLRRPTSRVLAVGPGGELGEIVALHRRRPSRTCTSGALSSLASLQSDAAAGALLVEGSSVWVVRFGRAIRHDGREEHDEGTPRQVLASRVLAWSSR